MERITNKDWLKISQQQSHLITKTVNHEKNYYLFCLQPYIYIQIFLFFFCILLLWYVCFFMTNWNWLDFCNYLCFAFESILQWVVKNEYPAFSKVSLRQNKKNENPLFLLLLVWVKNTFRSKDKTLTAFKSDMGFVYSNITNKLALQYCNHHMLFYCCYCLLVQDKYI